MEAQAALDLIGEWVRRGEVLSVDKVRELHRRVLQGSISASSGGQIRTAEVEPELLGWVEDFNAECQRPYRRRDDFLAGLADLHVRFHQISPFREGNGRTNRLLAFLFSLRHKHELVLVHDSYYRIIMRLCREDGSSAYFDKYLKALGDEKARAALLGELEEKMGFLT